LRIFSIDNEDINTIWKGFSEKVENEGCSCFLTDHGSAILSLLKTRQDLNLHSIRVHLADVSNSAVYYITYPVNNKIDIKKRNEAFKVMTNKKKFKEEKECLEKIKKVWKSNRKLYYIGNSDDSNEKQFENVSENYNWFGSLNNIESDAKIIIMLPALRRSNTRKDTNLLIFSQLLESLSFVHKAGVLHCDIRPSNCLKFSDGWQLVDFDLAIHSKNNCGEFSLKIGTEQQKCAGYRINEVIKSEVEKEEVMVTWTVYDDIEMLNIACFEINC
jgi:serine/threonine protein kinase